MNTIRLKKFVDGTGITLKQLSKQTSIPITIVTTMYYDGIFDGTKVDVNQLTSLMQLLNIININDLIPSIN